MEPGDAATARADAGTSAGTSAGVSVRSANARMPAATLGEMSEIVEDAAPRAHARIAYLGPISPHWEVYGDWGERQVLDEFRARALARLVLLPRDDPQFRRNKERINRDAERELISLEWDLGVPDEDDDET